MALFVSLGGVGYAATRLPANSVGTRQLRNNAVSFRKIHPNAVGVVRANTRQLQARVWRICGLHAAIEAISQNGDPSCNSTLPGETGTTSNTASLPTTGTPTQVATTNLDPGTNYLGLANPTVTVTPAADATGPQTASVSCTLTVGGNTSSRTITVTTPDKGDAGQAALSLQLTGTAGTAAISCNSKPVGLATGATAPTVSVTSAVNAIQIQ